MKIQNTKRIAEKIIEVMQLREVSSMVNMVTTNNIAANSIIPPDVSALRKEAELIHGEMPEYSVDKIMMLLMIESIIGPYLERQPDMMEFFMNWIAAESKVFDVGEFNDNPYIRDIDFLNKASGDYVLRYHENMPYELDVYNVPKRINELHIDIPRISCFPKTIKYPVIFQKSIKSTWMSVSPNEVFTMDNAIQNAKGKVLTLGCGMGYFAYMASLKSDVESVTIIELEQDVIGLFEEYILPQFRYKEKISVIKADAIEYLKDIKDGEYDYCFADIWIGIEDVVPYFSIKEIGRNFRKTKIDYWIEESFATLFSSLVWIEIIKSFSKENKVDIPDINESEMTDLEKRQSVYIEKLLENVEISKPEHIDYYLNPQNIISLIDSTDIVF